MIVTVFAVTTVSFIIIQLPPGDYLTTYIANLESQGTFVSEDLVASLKARFGLGEPLYVQYFRWVSGLFRGDWGISFQYEQPVSNLIWERFALTVVISFLSLLVTWAVAFPIGVYSATHQYSIGDYLFTVIGFVGRAIPDFMLALILMWWSYNTFGIATWGLFSEPYVDAPWSLGKVLDLLKHVWIPVLIISTSGAAGLIRVMRANLLDELKKPYVIAAKAKGVPKWKAIWKYPVRIAANPFISVLGWSLPQLVSGATIVSVVLSLPTAGPLFLRALQSQDMYLAGGFVLLLSLLTVIGTFISDILLVWLDPRIRYE